MDNEIIPFISKFWLNIQTFVIPFDSVLVLVKNNYLKVLVRFQILIKDSYNNFMPSPKREMM